MAGILKASINLTAIPKDKIIEGKKGKYIPIVININNEADQFGNHGPICVDQTKEERDAKEAKTYLGNIQVVWTDGQSLPERELQPASQKVEAKSDIADDDLPF
tara:strand:- start:636 stop:947 length:312 start_codon:yes stop_codon:yes gene_type:complete